ncbi:hypothetical protein GC170_21745 [bacterium]|nr:hypothetical protein [bacterium]
MTRSRVCVPPRHFAGAFFDSPYSAISAEFLALFLRLTTHAVIPAEAIAIRNEDGSGTAVTCMMNGAMFD